MGQLSAARVPFNLGTVNLASINAVDWAQFSDASGVPVNRKSGGGSLIGSITGFGGSTPTFASSGPTTFTWTGGAPVGTGSSADGLYGSSPDASNGLQLTFVADTTVRVARVYLNAYNCRVLLHASLSDSSATAIASFDTGLVAPGDGTRGAYVDITYQANAAGQTLTVQFGASEAGGWANVAIQAAAVLPAPSGGVITFGGDGEIAGTADLTAAGGDDWAVFGTGGTIVTKKSGGAGLISNLLNYGYVGGLGWATDGSGAPVSWTNGNSPASGSTSDVAYAPTIKVGAGLVLALPADTTTRIARFFLGSYAGRVRVHASLTDASAVPLQNASTEIVGSTSGVDKGYVDITYRAASAGQRLIASFSISENGNEWSNVGMTSVGIVVSASGATAVITANQTNEASNNGPVLPAWRTALGATLNQTAHSKIACIGDSTTAGAGAGTGGGFDDGHMRGIPAKLAAQLRLRGVPASFNSFFAHNNVDRVAVPNWNLQLALGTGWAPSTSVASIGGATLRFTGSSMGQLVFTPTEQYDTFDVYYLKMSGNGSFATKVGGGASMGTTTTSTANANGEFVKATFGATLGTQPIRIEPNLDGDVFIVGIDAYILAQEKVHVLNCGWSAGHASHFGASGAQAWHHPNAIAVLDPDLTILNCTINDWILDTPISSYKADLQRFITAAKAVGDVVVHTGVPSAESITPMARQLTFVQALRELASINGVPLVNYVERWGTQEANTARYRDTFHPNEAGYSEVTRVLVQEVLPPLLSVSSTPTATLTANQTNAATTQVATLARPARTITAAQTNEPTTQVATLARPGTLNIAAAQTNAPPTQTATLRAVAVLTANQTNAPTIQSVHLGSQSIVANQLVEPSTQVATLKAVATLTANQINAPTTQLATLGIAATFARNARTFDVPAQDRRFAITAR